MLERVRAKTARARARPDQPGGRQSQLGEFEPAVDQATHSSGGCVCELEPEPEATGAGGLGSIVGRPVEVVVDGHGKASPAPALSPARLASRSQPARDQGLAKFNSRAMRSDNFRLRYPVRRSCSVEAWQVALAATPKTALV